MSISYKAILEFAPGLVFLLGYQLFGMKVAIIGLLLSAAVLLVIAKLKGIKLENLILFAYAAVLIFGGLTLYTDDSYFIKIKPTVINTILAALTFCDIFRTHSKRFICKILPMFRPLSIAQLNRIAICWGCYFIFCAAINELVWRNFDEQTWVYFKSVGLLLINFIFIALNVFLLFDKLQISALKKDN